MWGPFVEALGDEWDVVRLSPPGFGAPLPEGFGATVTEYRDWLVAELEELVAVSGPVDLLGHDWGGGHVVNVATTRPDLLRTWATDVIGLFDPGYVWHDLAQGWQTPGVGEESVERMGSTPVLRRATGLAARGMDAAVADRVAAGFDDTMGRAILALYRSAVQPVLAELGRDLEAAAARPGLAIMPSEDFRVGTEEQRLRAAARAGARVEILDGLGHWWLAEDPARAAGVLVRFWRDA